MMLVGLGLIALFFVGPPGGTADNIPAEATPYNEQRGRRHYPLPDGPLGRPGSRAARTSTLPTRWEVCG